MAGSESSQASVGRHAGLCPGPGPGPEAARGLGAAGSICGHLDGPTSVVSAQPDAGGLASAAAHLQAAVEGPPLQPGLAAQQGGWQGAGRLLRAGLGCWA